MADIQIKTNEKEARSARGKRLAQVRKLANISRADFESQYGIKLNTLKGWELGRFTGLTEQGAKRVLSVCRLLGVQCSMGWLMEGVGKPPSILENVVSSSDGVTAELVDVAQKGKSVEIPAEIQLFCDTRPNALYMQVMDDSMEPYYFEGDYVAGECHYDASIVTDAVGKDCIIETQKGEILLRRVYTGSKEGYYALRCTNEKTVHPTPYLYDVELQSAAPVRLLFR